MAVIGRPPIPGGSKAAKARREAQRAAGKDMSHLLPDANAQARGMLGVVAQGKRPKVSTVQRAAEAVTASGRPVVSRAQIALALTPGTLDLMRARESAMHGALEAVTYLRHCVMSNKDGAWDLIPRDRIAAARLLLLAGKLAGPGAGEGQAPTDPGDMTIEQLEAVISRADRLLTLAEIEAREPIDATARIVNPVASS